jgi:hypothetical protein
MGTIGVESFGKEVNGKGTGVFDVKRFSIMESRYTPKTPVPAFTRYLPGL